MRLWAVACDKALRVILKVDMLPPADMAVT